MCSRYSLTTGTDTWTLQTIITLCVTDIVRHYSLCVSLLLNTVCVSLPLVFVKIVCLWYLLTTGTDTWTVQTIITLCVTAVKHCVCVTAISLCDNKICSWYLLSTGTDTRTVQTIITLCVTYIVRHYSLCVSLLLITLCVTAISLCVFKLSSYLILFYCCSCAPDVDL